MYKRTYHLECFYRRGHVQNHLLFKSCEFIICSLLHSFFKLLVISKFGCKFNVTDNSIVVCIYSLHYFINFNFGQPSANQFHCFVEFFVVHHSAAVCVYLAEDMIKWFTWLLYQPSELVDHISFPLRGLNILYLGSLFIENMTLRWNHLPACKAYVFEFIIEVSLCELRLSSG